MRIRDNIKYVDVVKIEDYGTTCMQSIEFGENLLDYAEEISAEEIATCVVPLGKVTQNEDGTNTYVTIAALNDGKDYVYNREAVNSFGWIKRTVKLNDVEEPEILLEEGRKWLSEYQFAKLTIELNAIDLSLLGITSDAFNLGDYVNTKAAPFGLDAWYYIRKKVTDLLFPEKNTVTVGNTVSKGFTEQTNTELKEMEKIIPISSVLLDAAKQNSSELIKSATSGNIYLVMDENGKPRELLIMDTQDTKTAKRVWRWNINGFGYSSTGYDGIYGIAMTMDGAIVADFITAGTMLADRIRGGTLEVGGAGLGADGTIVLKDISNHTFITLNKEGIRIFANDGTLLGKFDSGGVDVKKGSIKGADITLGGTDNTNGTMKILDTSGNVVAAADRQGMNIYRGMFASYASNGSDRATVTDGSFKVWKDQEESPIAYMGDGGWEELGESGSGIIILHGKKGIVLDASTGNISAQDLSVGGNITVNKNAELIGELDVYESVRMHDDLEVSGDIYAAGTSFETLEKRVKELETKIGG